MRHFFFLKSLVLLLLFFLFIRIYQHNYYMKNMYEQQKVDKAEKMLLLEYDVLQKQLVQALNYHDIKKKAVEQFGMSPLVSKKIIVLNNRKVEDA